ncbi:lytic transglycosylase [Thioclava sediminum]|uniref:Lytic transglycosylase n=1 Tax=Thioclava sediminum TaxID=1915319 RepID=A0ABX3MYD4_9RHOB|nr:MULTISPECIES: lytic transglycosylase [Thioclava]MAQ38673.1 lytic transglycosylase [Thioclava sp.]OOY08332.1 lytic transglycosylase [Thioclava sp. F36-7]OOY19029.1 lytic transglycosylase [Thioclava sp. DLFJ5-1]OOY24668.1 lytic transglycosylase [Thioclava sediminum]|tara:strand:- start:1299 stop:1877 length:579 start_codon:yes stop_codon:yes gene_type:complete
MKKYLALGVVLAVAACGGGPSKPPRNLDDACAIIKERPQYFNAMRRTEARWGVPVAVQMATIHQESKFDGNAKTPQRFALGIIPLGRQSSAYGYSQALDGTWDEYREDTHRFGARRNRISDATDFMGWYMDGTQKKLGISKADARNQYLAYHEGRGGYSRGSHRSKSWLLAVADRVASRAQMYEIQLQSCRR